MLRPFPIGIADARERQKTFDRYRNELIEQAGIAFLLMGNKEVGGKIVNADTASGPSAEKATLEGRRRFVADREFGIRMRKKSPWLSRHS